MNVINLDDHRKIPTCRQQMLFRDMDIRKKIREAYGEYPFVLVALACDAAGDALNRGYTGQRALDIADEVIKSGYYVPEPILTVEEKS
jgi:hypothetical protein